MGGINHYQYAPNPVNWVDPFGLSCKENGKGFLDWLLEDANEQIRNAGGWQAEVWSFFAEDSINAVNEVGAGDYRGALTSIALTVVKPFKVVDKALDKVPDTALKIDQFGNAQGPLRIGEATTYKNHNKRAIVGDELEGNHIPAIKQIIKSEELKRGRKLTKAEKAELKKKTGVLVEPKEVHAQGATFRGRNTKQRISEDASDLEKAATRDTDLTKQELLKKGFNEEVVDKEVTRLHEYNKSINVYDKKTPVKLSTDDD